jgi:hypothetical protein
MNPPREVRIGDAEREAAVSALGEHYAAGRLTKEEYDERAEQAWAARTGSGLTPLFLDLPAPHWSAPSQRAVAPQPSRWAAPRSPADRPVQRRGGFPFLPVFLLVLGLTMLFNVPWPLLLLFGWLLWRGVLFRAFGSRRWSPPGASHTGWSHRRW